MGALYVGALYVGALCVGAFYVEGLGILPHGLSHVKFISSFVMLGDSGTFKRWSLLGDLDFSRRGS